MLDLLINETTRGLDRVIGNVDDRMSDGSGGRSTDRQANKQTKSSTLLYPSKQAAGSQELHGVSERIHMRRVANVPTVLLSTGPYFSKRLTAIAKGDGRS